MYVYVYISSCHLGVKASNRWKTSASGEQCRTGPTCSNANGEWSDTSGMQLAPFLLQNSAGGSVASPLRMKTNPAEHLLWQQVLVGMRC